MDVRAEHLAGRLFVFPEQRRAGEADEDGVREPAAHLAVHVAPLRAVTLVHEHVESSPHRRQVAAQVTGVDLVQQGAHQALLRGRELLDEFPAGGDARRRRVMRDDAGAAHHAGDLLVQLVPVSDDQDSRVRFVLQQPLGEQHHQDALPAALGVPDHAALAPTGAQLRRLDRLELVHARHLLQARVEDHEVPHHVQQALRGQQFAQRAVQQRALRQVRSGGRSLCCRSLRLVRQALPAHEELLRRAHGAVVQALRVVARQDELHRAEEPLVEDLLLVGDELPHAVRHVDGAALEFDDGHRQPVQVHHQVRAAPVRARTLQRDLFRHRKMVALRALPVDQVHRLVRRAGLDLHGHAVTQQSVGTQVRLVQRHSGAVCRRAQLL